LKKRILAFTVFLICLAYSHAQEIDIGAGINYGGPIPTETLDSTSGSPLLGAIANVSFSFPLGERFSFVPGLQYAFRGMDYGQIYTRDTMITIEYNGTSGQVPSYYTAYVAGQMRLHYIDIPLLVGYRFWKIQMLLGPYVSFLVGGKDAGDVEVVIGTGGVFDDHYEEFNNYPALRKAEIGFMLGSSAPIYKNLGIEVKVTRSFCTLYDLDKLNNNGQDLVKMYSTYLQLGLIYKIKGE
jgi:hypothetical protein